MLKYANSFKDILSNKWRVEEHETVMLIEGSSGILQKKLSPKQKDLRILQFLAWLVVRNLYSDAHRNYAMSPVKASSILKYKDFHLMTLFDWASFIIIYYIKKQVIQT